MQYFLTLLPLAVISISVNAAHPNAPPLQLAARFQQQDVRRYWVSEKLDGVRAYWDGEALWSRAGHRFMAPKWFIASFPQQHLDGELWLGRGQFEKVSAVVRRYQASDDEWREVRFMVFDMPNQPQKFSERVLALNELASSHSSPYLAVVAQRRLPNNQALASYLAKIVSGAGEGVMLRHQDSFYQPGRNQELLKLKQFQDAEAKVVAYLPGQGKYKNMLGALVVQDKEGRQFRLGSGFSDKQRHSPPAIGSIITYRYQGQTHTGQPRFAHFLRVRDDEPKLGGKSK
ncbi:DNA ligase [Oceanisphaera avium]|uniref:DNA ligase n=1 Tax=Oceanisphaera avium TaxID=1903694 RepID=A0A1Y0CUY0_9GAMM|nr:DNA ligase [Oceanisphaera avium]ART79092.1 DNA ligase [Oceanisphaera avium]